MKHVIKFLLLIAFALICRFYIIEYPVYNEAANKNDAAAQYELGKRYYTGRTGAGRYGGHKQDYNKAFKWWLLAAKQGNADAQYGLGECYYFGNGIYKDLSEAVKWWLLAAEQGDAYAQNFLGLCYENGRGVDKDLNEAIKWYRKAAEQGHENAKNRLKALGVD